MYKNKFKQVAYDIYNYFINNFLFIIIQMSYVLFINC